MNPKILPLACFAMFGLLVVVAVVSPPVDVVSAVLGLAGGCLATPLLRRRGLLVWLWLIYSVVVLRWSPYLGLPLLLLLCAARRGDIPISGNQRLLCLVILLAILFFVLREIQWILMGGFAGAVALLRRDRPLGWVGSGAVLSAMVLWLGWLFWSIWRNHMFFSVTLTPSFSPVWFRVTGSNWFGGVEPGEWYAASARIAEHHGLAVLGAYGFLLSVLFGCLVVFAAWHRESFIRSLAAATAALLTVHTLLHMCYLLNGRIFAVSLPFIHPFWSKGTEAMAEAACIGVVLGGVFFGRRIRQERSPQAR